ncbi:MAG: radical SAM protein [Deltaproteobacteria bacterium]|nr:radical SAM protein [Deltaproteobacteria bacterium]
MCLSSQVGCAMGCDFCATGRLGLRRNLAAPEILAAFVAVRDEAPGRVTGAVFQGQGEPLHNYDEVMRAGHRLRDPWWRLDRRRRDHDLDGRARAARSAATPPIVRRFRLIVSLTTTDPVHRRRLPPVASRFGLDELAAALRAPGRPRRSSDASRGC